MGNYSIEACSLPIVGGVAGHDFWVLKDDGGNVLAELHGLATSRSSGEVLPIGYSMDHSLRVHLLVRDQDYGASIDQAKSPYYYYDSNQPSYTVLSAPKDEILARWGAAIDAMPIINRLDLDYPPLGFSLLSDTVNSNSAYKTMGEIMGVVPHNFSWVLEPGIDHDMISIDLLSALKYRPVNQIDLTDDFWGALFGVVDDSSGSRINYISVETTTVTGSVGVGASNTGSFVNMSGQMLFGGGDYDYGSLLGDVNVASGLKAVAHYAISDDLRPGDLDLNAGLPVDTFLFNYTTQMLDAGLIGSLLNTGFSGLDVWQAIDPLVLDLNRDGVKFTNFSDAPVLFDMDNDGGSQEQTGWVDVSDGILVHDLSGDGVINNISETLSEYYKGAAGSGGNAGSKPYANGFLALKSLDTGSGVVGSPGFGDGVFDSKDAAWSQLRVWVDANHDGRSWIDGNANGVKDAGEASELKTFADVSITQINLLNQSQSGEVRNGNEVLAQGTFVKAGVPHEIVAAKFLNNPAGSTLTKNSTGTIAALDGGNVKSFASSNANSAIGETLSTTTLGVKNVTGGAGNDTLSGDAQNNWLVGGLGVDKFIAGAGDDVILADAVDLSKPDAVDGGEGLDMVQIIGSTGGSLNMFNAHVEIAVGNVGDDVIVGGGSSSVFVRGGDGNDVIFGSAANDALSGEDGRDYIDGAAGNDIIRGHRGRDQLNGGSGDDVVDGGLEDDRLDGGEGNDVLKGGGGDDFLSGGDGVDVAEYSGSYGDYRVTKINSDTWRVVDVKSGREGGDTLTSIEALSFSDVTRIQLNAPNALPVKDVVSKDSSSQLIGRATPFYISKQQLLANDRSWSGDALVIMDVLEAVGGTAKLITNAQDPHNGDILFTPDPAFAGVMSFKYHIKTSGSVVSVATNPATGQAEQIKATVYLQTPDLPVDPEIFDEWYLNSINAVPVWSDYTGRNVNVGIFEATPRYSTGAYVFDYENPDLQPNVSRAWLGDTSSQLTTNFSNHATMVAGVIAAARNGEGAVGVAYNAIVTGESLEADQGVMSIDTLESAMAKFRNFDVVNNSWGGGLPFHTWIEGVPNGIPTQLWDAAMYGRNGMGTVVVASAGNDREKGGNTNYDALTSVHSVITVASINTVDDLGSLTLSKRPYSNPGASILISAPGTNIKTISNELINANGSILNGDAASVSGTSFAAPIVSGVVALMLEAQPKLGYRDVQNILAVSAKKIDNTGGTVWVTNGAKNWNGGGMHVSHDYGFGEVDARAAVRLAETLGVTHYGAPSAKSATSGSINGVIPDGVGSFSSQLSIAGGLEVESAQVTIQIDHPRLGDLIIKLISPSGTESILMDRPGKALGSQDSDTGLQNLGKRYYSFNTTHVRGEQSGGNWRLEVLDAKTGAVGSVSDWMLDLYGAIDPSQSETYYYTDEFAASNNDRLNDTDGGALDALNAAAVSSSSRIDLGAGKVCTIAGKNLTTDGNVEYAYGGDGSDTITGNAFDNLLWGGRGDDSLDGAGGNDVLIDGRGNNTYVGGMGRDLFAIQYSPGSVQTISDVELSAGEKIALIGFSDNADFSILTFSDVSGGVRVGLPEGQALIVRNVSASALSEQSFSFFKDMDAFNKYLSYWATTNGIGSSAVDSFRVFDSAAFGLGGNDSLIGRGLKELLDGGDGSDYLDGEYVSPGEGYPAIPEGDDWLEGGAGGDVLYGRGGNDYINGGGGSDVAFGGGGQDTLIGSGGSDDFLDGGAGDDIIYMDGDLAWADLAATQYRGLRIGGAGSDTFYVSRGGGGLSGYYVDGNSLYASNLIQDFDVSVAGDKIDLRNFGWIESIHDLSIKTVVSGGVTSTSIEALNGAEQLDIMLYGVSSANVNAAHFKFAINSSAVTWGGGGADALTGDAGGNVIYGGKGVDTMTGRTGDDIYYVDDGADVINELPGGGFDIVKSGFSYALAENVEVLNLYGGANIDGLGNSGRNVLRGNDGGNRLDGGGGADDLLGGGGNDVYVVDDQLDVVVEMVDQGDDSIESSVSFGLSANVENMTLIGGGGINATGNDLANRLKGNASNNILDGAGGADTMEGLAGDDVYYLDDTSDVVTEVGDAGTDTVYVPFSYSVGSNVENAVIYGDALASLTGNDLGNVLVGNVANNSLYGQKGNDTLDGGGGGDTMEGGADDDTYVVNDDQDKVTEIDGGGADLVLIKGLATYSLSNYVESGMLLTAGTLSGNALANTLTGSVGGDNLVGAEGADSLYGEDGMDTLNGGSGIDSMTGGADNDTYIVDNSNDVVVEKAEADIYTSYDTIQSSASYTVPDYVEAITLTGTADINATANNIGCELNGNVGKNYLKGGDGLDFIFGDDGADTLEGGLGDDYYYLTDNTDTVIEQAGGGLDQIWAYGDGIRMADNVERLYMQSYLARTAYGNDGNNLMAGNNRANTLYGNGGNDKLFGYSGNDTIYGGLGNDSLYGSVGNDTYHFQRGDGADTIYDSDGTVGNQDQLLFDGAINADQVWLAKSGNDLVVSVIGTTDKVTINSWYLGGLYQVESIVAGGNGKTLSAANVQNLVNAMASFTPPAVGQTTLPANYQAALNGVIAANWA